MVFKSIEDLRRRTDDPDLPFGPDSVMVLQNCGPQGYPGMAEVGNMPIPKKLLAQGNHPTPSTPPTLSAPFLLTPVAVGEQA